MTLRQPTTHGLVLSSDRHRLGLEDGAYQRAMQRGELVRLRRGAYCDAEEWRELSLRERYLLRIGAVSAASSRPLVFCGYSAAALWAMPILGDWPSEVHVVSDVAAGGRSRNGVVRHSIAHAVTNVEKRHGFAVTTIAGTAIDMALALPFSQAVGCVDWSLWKNNERRVSVEALRTELELRNPRYRRRHADAIIDFATSLSDSYGESLARAVMCELGFAIPELQVRFDDAQGIMVVDYFWPIQNIAGEFDGKSKYLRPSFGPPLSPGEIVWREKRREDRLRRQVSTVIRLIMADVLSPSRLAALLIEAGIPRR